MRWKLRRRERCLFPVWLVLIAKIGDRERWRCMLRTQRIVVSHRKPSPSITVIRFSVPLIPANQDLTRHLKLASLLEPTMDHPVVVITLRQQIPLYAGVQNPKLRLQDRWVLHRASALGGYPGYTLPNTVAESVPTDLRAIATEGREFTLSTILRSSSWPQGGHPAV